MTAYIAMRDGVVVRRYKKSMDVIIKAAREGTDEELSRATCWFLRWSRAYRKYIKQRRIA